MSITIIAALTKDRVIGKDNNLPWHISEDLQNFKKLTSGNTVVMGRKTYESIGKPLPNRKNIVVSRSVSSIEGVDVCSSLEDAIEKAKSYGKEIFIIGGASIYEMAIPLADKMYLSYVKVNYKGDTYFPKFDKDVWDVVSERTYNEGKDEEFNLVIYKRKNVG